MNGNVLLGGIRFEERVLSDQIHQYNSEYSLTFDTIKRGMLKQLYT